MAIDLDGTLLDKHKRVGRRTVAALADVARRGQAHVVLATARPPRAVRAIYQNLALVAHSIHYNGVLIWDERRGRSVYHRPMPGPLCAEMAALARGLRPEVLVQAEIHDRAFTDRDDTTHVTETNKLFKFDGVMPLERIFKSAVTKLMFLGPPATLSPVEAALHKAFAPKVSLLRTDRDLIQIMDRRGGKAAALQKVAAFYDVPRREVMAIGDNLNDYGMVRWSGVGVAVDNAHPALKKVADWVAPSNDDEGVCEALERYGVT